MKRNTIRIAAGFALLIWEGALSYAERIPAGGYLVNPYLSCTATTAEGTSKIGGSLNSKPLEAELHGGFKFTASIAKNYKLHLTLMIKGTKAQSLHSINVEAMDPAQSAAYRATIDNLSELTLSTMGTGPIAIVKCSLYSSP